MTPLDAARAYVARGWAPVPVPHGEKAPTLIDWQTLRLANERELTAYFNGQEMNIGILTGDPSGGLVDVDVDAREAVAVASMVLPPTGRVSGRASKRASHFWYTAAAATAKFRDPAGGATDKGMLVELRASRLQTIVPPSVHPTGERIEWEREGEPVEIDAEALHTAVARLAAAALLARRWPGVGVRHDFALALAGFLLRGGLEEHAAALIVEAAARAAGDAEWCDRRRAVHDTAGALATGKPVTGGPTLVEFLDEKTLTKVREWLGLAAVVRFDPEAAHLTDLGNAQRFSRQHGEDTRYCYPLRTWFTWTGAKWIRDAGAGVMGRTKETVRSLYAEAATQPEDGARVALAGWAKRSEHEARLRAMLYLAQSDLPVAVEQLDAGDYLLNVRNGTLDLRAGQLRPHDRRDLLTKMVPVDYDPGARCPTFETFLARIFDGRARLIDFLQRAIGYSLTGDTREQCFFLLWGRGANGKTTLVKTIFGLLGDYALSTRAETFMVKGPDAIPNDVARLRAARYVIAVEADQGQRLAESLVKQATGGDVMTARFMRAEYFDFVPAFKIFLVTNHKPVIRGTDLAMWRRVRLVPFTVTIPPEEQDRQLEAKLRQEWPGILRWAVEGCLAWQRDGLDVPEEVRAATLAYRLEMDSLADFIRERCVVEPEAEETAAEIYRAYKEWAEGAGERPMARHVLGQRLEEHGFEPGRTGKKGRFWTGVRCRTPADPSPGGDVAGEVTCHDALSLIDSHDARAICITGNPRHPTSPASPRTPPTEEVEL